jgi:glycine/D-amino acid oxidase-like deaminating enzyme
MATKSYLIVGQGIGGSLLAWELHQRGAQVLIVDDNHHQSSSIISAGIINPITGQRLALTPHIDLYLPCALKTYTQLSQKFGQTFFIPKPIIRILRSAKELERAHFLQTTSAAKPYIGSINAAGFYGSSFHDPFGSMTIIQGGYCQTQLLVKSMQEYFLNRQMLVNEKLSYDDLVVKSNDVHWKSQKFDKVIFAEGFKAAGNPWFKALPFNLAKGELIKVKLDAPLPDAIICQQQWFLPLGDSTFLAGSTYDRMNINTRPTDEGQKSIIEGLNAFIKADIQILESYAGVRPVMIDQTPRVDATSVVGIFNGFGSKAILLAPHYAQNLLGLNDPNKNLAKTL